MEYHWSIRKNKLLIHATTWMILKGVMLSEKKGYILYDSTYIMLLKIIVMENRSVVIRDEC